MSGLLLGDEIVVKSTCVVPSGAVRPSDLIWTGRVRRIEGPLVTMSILTEGGAEVLLQADSGNLGRDDDGRWEVTLPMTHRLMEPAQA
ncbi:hypothetical protein [Geminicoccus flavidas]|uniref:hypothetical protein n=1 Tax=Geminicoccus flavidas TaxID=2506407 RepID=UPI00135747A1|nr:hypothetical protein [Geminicoccus flavidas]